METYKAETIASQKAGGVRHTPGPWYYGPSSAIEGGFVIQGSYENGGGPRLPVLGRTHNFPHHAEANARLIAASPDMYEALKRMVADLREIEKTHLCHRSRLQQIADISAAIAKAEGR